MKKITVKVPAKINLTLDILGANENYHEISSLVTSIDIYDEIITCDWNLKTCFIFYSVYHLPPVQKRDQIWQV